MEKFEYLFIDLKWNTPEVQSTLNERDIVSIGAVGTDGDGNILRTFSKAVQPRNPESITDNTCSLTHQTRESLMLARSEYVVLENFFQTFFNYKKLIFWSRQAYEQFENFVYRNDHYLKRHRAIILQEVVDIVVQSGRRLSYKDCLINAHVEFKEEFLYYSKHDARYLYELYWKMHTLLGDENAPECIVNHRTKVIHQERCRYVQKMQKPNINAVDMKLFLEGYQPCKCCGLNNTWKYMQWKREKRKSSNYNGRSGVKVRGPLSERGMIVYCERLGLKCNVAEGVVFISSSFGRWQIFMNGNKVCRVMHGNYNAGDDIDAYHIQKIRADSFFDVVQYIYYHDKDFMRHLNEKGAVDISSLCLPVYKESNRQESKYRYRTTKKKDRKQKELDELWQ